MTNVNYTEEVQSVIGDLMKTTSDFDYYEKGDEVLWIRTDAETVTSSTLTTLKEIYDAEDITVVSKSGCNITIGVLVK